MERIDTQTNWQLYKNILQRASTFQVETKDEDIEVEENEEYTKIEYKKNFEVDYEINIMEEETIEGIEGSITSENDADDEVEVDSDSRSKLPSVSLPSFTRTSRFRRLCRGQLSTIIGNKN